MESWGICTESSSFPRMDQIIDPTVESKYKGIWMATLKFRFQTTQNVKLLHAFRLVVLTKFSYAGDLRFDGHERVQYTREQLLELKKDVDIPESIMKIKQDFDFEILVKIKAGFVEEATVAILSLTTVTGVGALHILLPLEREDHGNIQMVLVANLNLGKKISINTTFQTSLAPSFQEHK